MVKKMFFVLSLVFVLNFFVIENAYALESEVESEPSVAAKGAVLVEQSTGRILWEKNGNEPMAMASTTKIMTAIIAIEEGDLDKIITVSKRAASAPKVKMNLSEGEKQRLGDLLYPLMLESSNDAAIAIAEGVSGSVEEFCERMTQKAVEIGAENTVFVTPNGLDEGDHHSTAEDMAIITAYALNNEKFMDIINTESITIPTVDNGCKSYSFVNKNRFLKEYNGALGVKTGFTNKAGQCFVGAAERDGMKLISVVLASGWGTVGKEQKWRDTKEILNYGFENYSFKTLCNEGDNYKAVPVMFSKEGEVGTVLKDSVKAPVAQCEDLKCEYLLKAGIEAPVKKGDIVGRAVFFADGEFIGETDIIAGKDIERNDLQNNFKKVIDYWLNSN